MPPISDSIIARPESQKALTKKERRRQLNSRPKSQELQAGGGERDDSGRDSSLGGDSPKVIPTELAPSIQSSTPPRQPFSISPQGEYIGNSNTRQIGSSPLLTAFKPDDLLATTNPVPANDWTKGMQQGLPGAGVPDDVASTREMPPEQPFPFGDLEEGFNNAPLSTSPPTGNPLPSSYMQPYPYVGGTFADQQRKLKGPVSQPYIPVHGQYAGQSPLPHQPQAHFYSAPDGHFDGPPTQGLERIPGDGGLHCGFDSLATAGDAFQNAENVVLVGNEGELDVYKADSTDLHLIGRMTGLRGSVLDAKILPVATREDDMVELRPLVVMVIHGPEDVTSIYNGPSEADEPQKRRASTSAPHTSIPTSKRRSGDRRMYLNEETSYRTTVEVYSLKTRERISVLFASPPSERRSLGPGPWFSPPPPVGELQLDANGRFVVIASELSGEIFIFSLERSTFRCLGKVWTKLRTRHSRSVSPSSNSSDSGSQPADSPAGNSGQPLFSLSHRWLTYLPATSPSRTSLKGIIFPGRPEVFALGIRATAAPPPPLINCAIKMPDSETLLNRVTREMTQELIKGAKWVGDQGIQAWRSYWNRPSGHIDPTTIHGGHAHRRDTQAYGNPSGFHPFPPTHAYNTQQSRSNSEPSLISILDLDKMSKVEVGVTGFQVTPMATFQSPLGCSFLSFSPDGLKLLTASTNGDVQLVWDLMRILGGASNAELIKDATQTNQARRANQGPFVRQVARFSRMTVANIVDVVWSLPRGEKLAVLTDKGTVHLFDLPVTALQWPPPRRSPRSSAQADTEIGALNEGTQRAGVSQGSPGSAVSAAIKMVTDTTQPYLAAAQRRRRSSGTGLGSLSGRSIATNGVQGSKMVAAGLSKSLGAASGTISNLRSAREQRLHLPHLSGMARPGSVRFLSGRQHGQIGLIGDGLLRIYTIKQKLDEKSAKRISSVEQRFMDLTLDSLPDTHISKPTSLRSTPDGEEVLKPPGPDGFWKTSLNPNATTSTYTDKHPLSYAEIETNPPYQPFHTDRRINLFALEETPQNLAGGRVHPDLVDQRDAWVFGEDIPSRRLKIHPTHSDNDPRGTDASERRMENVFRFGNDEEGDQVIITTRRKRRTANGTEVEDGFFEDDCEVLEFASDQV